MKFDKEYRTCYFREVEYLKSKGINGKLYNVSDKYNSAFKLEFSTYPFDAFIAFEFVKDGV